jgi:hypothetical protein
VGFREMRRRSRGRREGLQSRPGKRRGRRSGSGRRRRSPDRTRRPVDLRFLALRLRNDEDEVGVPREASEAGSSTTTMPSGAARLRRPRWREGGSARGTGGIRRPRGWRVSRSWDRGLTRPAPRLDGPRRHRTPAGRLAHRRTGAQAASSQWLFQFHLPVFEIA